MSKVLYSATLAAGLMLSAASTEANVITDWDATGAAVTPPSAAGLREMAIMHVAMFDAVNSIARTYTPYMTSVPALPGACAWLNFPNCSANGSSLITSKRLSPAS